MLAKTDVIDEKVIEACKMAAACRSGLTWLMEKQRTYAQLRSQSMDW